MNTVIKDKMVLTVKRIDWNLLVMEMLEGMLLTEKELAKRCKVSQQCVSTWKIRTRKPGPYAKRKLAEIAREVKLDLNRYETDTTKDAIVKFLENNHTHELAEMFDLYRKISCEDKIKLLKYANTLAKKAQNKD
ncbi:MAG: hypothetical protein WC637_15620 [Victivallales bacterium]|jgi:transposase